MPGSQLLVKGSQRPFVDAVFRWIVKPSLGGPTPR